MERLNSKILLFGEYSALDGSMALVLPWKRYWGHWSFYNSDIKSGFALRSNQYLKDFSYFLERHPDENILLDVKQFEEDIKNGLFFESNIAQGYGLGSSGAVVAAVVLRYATRIHDLKSELTEMTVGQMQQLRTSLGKLESFFHGSSSGLDPLCILINKPLLLESNKEIITTQLPPLNEAGSNVVFLLNTGISRTTSRLMTLFQDLYKDPKFKTKIKNELVSFTNESINEFLDNQPSYLYRSLDQLSRFQLSEMSDFIPHPFEQLAQKGLEHGDYFLKLCGAGGGGYIIGFTGNWDRANQLLRDYHPDVIYRY